MRFENQITRAPHSFDPDRGAEAVTVLGVTGATADVVAGAAGCSPYLAGLMTKERDWLLSAFDDPAGALRGVLEGVEEFSLAALPGGLRQAKRRVALLAGLCDLGGVWSLEDVTKALTDLADRSCQAALVNLTAAEIGRGKLPGMGEQDSRTAAGLTALAMGKMGAAELNYSSDIDLIMLFDETLYDYDDLAEVRAVLVRITRRMAAMLGDVTSEGYVFRTDLRLRPDASVTPVCLSMAAAEAYYESEGRTWERAAYIKARPCAGDLAAGQRFVDTLRPFVWRRHLDFAAIEDAHDMRLRIRAHKRLAGPLDLMGHNMKLGRGGIREIEFFTQTRQLIAGGRDPSLRLRGTVEGLAALAKAGWIELEVAQGLTRHYRLHREVEHRLQMINDAQTHDLPSTDEGFARLAAFMGTEAKALEADLLSRLEEVHTLTEGFFAPGEAAAPVTGFGEDIVARWPGYPALRSERAAAIFRRLRPEILTRLQEAAKPEEALVSFDAFLAGLPAGVQLFSLFDANPQLTRLIVDIAATAPALAEYLSRNSSVFDAVIVGDFFAPWPGEKALRTDLSRVLEQAGDYEAALNAARRWGKEWHFRVGVHHLRDLITADEAGLQYADLARAVVSALWPVVGAEFARKHGPPPGRGACVLAMGSLGAGRLNAGSDLDLIVIYDGQDDEMSEGRRPLATRPYFARLTQAMITAITAPTSEGRLYEVDMRLRPSGRQGPVATSLQSFGAYQRDEAWTWEHLALTRAYPLAGDAGLLEDVEAERQAVLAEVSGRAAVRADVAEMRARLAEAKPGQGPLDVKAGPGRLMDVELAAQTLALLAASPERRLRRQIAAGVQAGLIAAEDADALSAAAASYWRVQAALRLLNGAARGDTLGEGPRRFVLRGGEAETVEDLGQSLAETASHVSAVVDRLLEG